MRDGRFSGRLILNQPAGYRFEVCLTPGLAELDPMDRDKPKSRLVSLDQFRGYTIAGMDLVNFVGRFVVSPYLFKHHNTFCSYADTIMPHFLFAVGFSFRLSFGRRELAQGAAAAYLRVLRRLLGL